jgi:glycosyltransferase involved in cell wall biosynthesis
VLFYPLSMQRIVINRLDRIITSSSEGVGTLGRAFGLPAEKLSVVYNGMDVEAFRNTGEPRRERTLLFVGNTEDHKKGMRYLFEALAMLPEDVTLTIVDEGPPKRLTAWGMIQELGLERRVSFTGKVSLSELVSLYSTCAVTVMASLHEGFGLPAAEAMACETPVVATTAGALPEVVGDDGAGLLVPPRDPAAIRDAVEKLLGDEGLRMSMGKKGRRRAERNFAWPVAAKNTLAVYHDVIESYRSRS